MANRTVKDAVYIKGTNPQYLIEKIIRTRIYDSRYWKEECFALTAELLVDKAMELKSIGGVYGGNVKPSPFLCLILKMLQIQPEKEIIIEFIRNEDFKYVRALGAFYMRLIATSAELYKYLEPLYIDYRKMKRMTKDAKYQLVHMDEFIDELLHGERVCDISLPRIQKRYVLEDLNEIEPRISALDVNIDEVETSSSSSSESEAEVEEVKEKERKKIRRHVSPDNNESKNIDQNRRKESRSAKEPRRRYIDYDNPDPAEEIKRYRRSPSPVRKHSRRSRSRSHSRHDDRHKRRNDSADRRDRPRSSDRSVRERDGERRRNHDRSLDRQRGKDRSRDTDRHHERKKRRDSGDDGREARNDEQKKERKKSNKHKRRSDDESD